MMSPSKCPACGYVEGQDIPVVSLLKRFSKENRDKLTEVISVMKVHHQYDGPSHYRMFLQGISRCHPEVIDSICREWLSKKLYITKSLAYLRGWMVRENERHRNKQKADLATYGCQPPIIE